MCVNSVLLLQVQCPDTPPSLRGLNTKAPLSPSIRRTFCPQITLLRRQVYGELNLVRKGIFGCNLHFFLPSDVPSLSPLLLNIIALGIKLSMEKAVSFKWPQYFVHTFNFCQTLLYSKMLIKDFLRIWLTDITFSICTVSLFSILTSSILYAICTLAVLLSNRLRDWNWQSKILEKQVKGQCQLQKSCEKTLDDKYCRRIISDKYCPAIIICGLDGRE